MQKQSHPKIIKFILWTALFMTNFIYLGMMSMLSSTAGGALPSDFLLAVGVMFVVISFLIPRFVRPNPAVPNSENVPFILSLAINEAASVIAFIVGFIGHDRQKAYVLFAISLVGFIFKFPREVCAGAIAEKTETKSKLDL